MKGGSPPQCDPPHPRNAHGGGPDRSPGAGGGRGEGLAPATDRGRRGGAELTGCHRILGIQLLAEDRVAGLADVGQTHPAQLPQRIPRSDRHQPGPDELIENPDQMPRGRAAIIEIRPGRSRHTATVDPAQRHPGVQIRVAHRTPARIACATATASACARRTPNLPHPWG